MSETEILDAVEQFFDGRGVMGMLRQVSVGERRIDAIVVTEGGFRVAIEAKSTRADYRNETAAKRAPTEAFAHACWYAAPPGVVDHVTVPSPWGLLIVDSPHSVRLGRDALTRRPQVTDDDAASLLWRCWHAEQRALPGSIAAARVQIEALESEVGYAREALHRERARAEHAASQVLALSGPQPCADCGEELRYGRTRGWFHERHTEAVCGPLRAEQYRQERESATGAAYALSAPLPPVPQALAGRPEQD